MPYMPLVWREAWDPPFQSRPSPSDLDFSSNSGFQGPLFSLSILYMIPWNSYNGEIGDTIEFDQPHKQTESKMQVTGKISSNK